MWHSKTCLQNGLEHLYEAVSEESVIYFNFCKVLFRTTYVTENPLVMEKCVSAQGNPNNFTALHFLRRFLSPLEPSCQPQAELGAPWNEQVSSAHRSHRPFVQWLPSTLFFSKKSRTGYCIGDEVQCYQFGLICCTFGQVRRKLTVFF